MSKDTIEINRVSKNIARSALIIAIYVFLATEFVMIAFDRLFNFMWIEYYIEYTELLYFSR